MCKFKSAIILKDRVFIPDYDHHTAMLEELGIADTRKNAERLFVRAELIPAKNDVFSNIDDWHFNVDQDIQPEWFVAEYEKQRMIKAVKEWAKTHIYIGKNGLKIENNKNLYIKDCKNVVVKNSTVKALGNSTVKALGNSTVKALGNSTVEALGNSTVEAWDNSTVKALGNSTVEAWDNSTVEALGNSTVIKPEYSSFNTSRLILSQNSTFKDCDAKTIYQSGDYKLVSVTDGKVS